MGLGDVIIVGVGACVVDTGVGAGVGVGIEVGVVAGVTTGTAVEAGGVRVSRVTVEGTGTGVSCGAGDEAGAAQAPNNTMPISRIPNSFFALI